MTTTFPTTLDTFPSAATLAGHQLSTDPHSTLHGNLGDCVAAAEAKIGVDGSAVTTSLDYKVQRLLPGPSQGRLTLTTAVPVTTADVTGATTVYFTPYKGDGISLYDTGSSKWFRYTFAEISASLAGLADTVPTDVFAYWTGSAVALELVNWTNSTTRATALALQDGVRVKSGDASRMLLGTICGSGAGTCEDSLAKRYVQNYYNLVSKKLLIKESQATWSYNTAAYRPANNSTANQVKIVAALAEEMIEVEGATVSLWDGSGVGRGTAIGLDSTSVGSFDVFKSSYLTAYDSSFAFVATVPAAGYHFYQLLEIGPGSGTVTWNGGGVYTSIRAVWRC